jgi:pseudouridine synthase
MAKQRLHKLLAERGLASRRAAEEIISAGRVTVNGRVVAEMGLKVDAATDIITIDGKPLPQQPRLRYILLHKPVGYLCSVKDEHGKKSVLSLLPNTPERLYPVGRLDYDSSGLLLLTNDGALTHTLLHPSREITKTYLAEVAGPVSAAGLDKLRRGLPLPDGPTAPAHVTLLRRAQGASTLEITIYEGKKRQVRRMCEHIGHPVRRLIRLRLGPLSLGRLKAGEWRELSPREVRELKKPVNNRPQRGQGNHDR